jgi:hypothetical protein
MIQPADAIALTQLDGNIDVDNLKPSIYAAQTTHLKAFLGLKLYTKIYTDFDSDDLAGEYLIIFNDYIKDFLSYYASALFVDFGGYKVSENGLHKVAGENMTSLSETEIATLSLKYTKLVANVEANFKEYVSDKNLPELSCNSINIQSDHPWL